MVNSFDDAFLMNEYSNNKDMVYNKTITAIINFINNILGLNNVNLAKYMVNN